MFNCQQQGKSPKWPLLLAAMKDEEEGGWEGEGGCPEGWGGGGIWRGVWRLNE